MDGQEHIAQQRKHVGQVSRKERDDRSGVSRRKRRRHEIFRPEKRP
jgi:hypothetical protein